MCALSKIVAYVSRTPHWRWDTQCFFKDLLHRNYI